MSSRLFAKRWISRLHVVATKAIVVEGESSRGR
jgi:hypothetical protein